MISLINASVVLSVTTNIHFISFISDWRVRERLLPPPQRRRVLSNAAHSNHPPQLLLFQNCVHICSTTTGGPSSFFLLTSRTGLTCPCRPRSPLNGRTEWSVFSSSCLASPRPQHLHGQHKPPTTGSQPSRRAQHRGSSGTKEATDPGRPRRLLGRET